MSSTTTPPPTPWTVDQLAEHWQLASVTVRRMISRGDLPAYRIGRHIRIDPRDVVRIRKPVTNAAVLRGGGVDA